MDSNQMGLRSRTSIKERRYSKASGRRAKVYINRQREQGEVIVHMEEGKEAEEPVETPGEAWARVDFPQDQRSGRPLWTSENEPTILPSNVKWGRRSDDSIQLTYSGFAPDSKVRVFILLLVNSINPRQKKPHRNVDALSWDLDFEPIQYCDIVVNGDGELILQLVPPENAPRMRLIFTDPTSGDLLSVSMICVLGVRSSDMRPHNWEYAIAHSIICDAKNAASSSPTHISLLERENRLKSTTPWLKSFLTRDVRYSAMAEVLSRKYPHLERYIRLALLASASRPMPLHLSSSFSDPSTPLSDDLSGSNASDPLEAEFTPELHEPTSQHEQHQQQVLSHYSSSSHVSSSSSAAFQHTFTTVHPASAPSNGHNVMEPHSPTTAHFSSHSLDSGIFMPLGRNYHYFPSDRDHPFQSSDEPSVDYSPRGV